MQKHFSFPANTLPVQVAIVLSLIATCMLTGCGRLVSRSDDGKMVARFKSGSGEASPKAIAEDPFPSAAQAGIATAK